MTFYQYLLEEEKLGNCRFMEKLLEDPPPEHHLDILAAINLLASLKTHQKFTP